MTLRQHADPPTSHWLLDMVLQPAEPRAHKGSTEDAIIRTLRGRQNRVQIGVPQTIDVLSSWPSNDRLTEEIQAMRATSDFSSVRLACSFVADRGCRFRWARLTVRLEVPEGSGSSSALVLDMFPREVSDECRYSRSFDVTAGMKLAFVEVKAERGGKAAVLAYEPKVTGAGLLTNGPNWTFAATGREGISGIKELFLLVKKPRGATVCARFDAAAEVQTALGAVPLRRYAEPELLSASYELSPG